MIQKKVAQYYAALVKNRNKIPKFLTQQYHEAALVNAFGPSQRLEVDPATVTRFAQRLGYAGYPELLREIQAMVKKELKAAYKPPVKKEDEEGLFLQALAQEKENLDRAMTYVNGETVGEMVCGIRAARNVYVVGQGLAKGPAQIFVSHLRGLLGILAQLAAPELMEAPMFLSSLSREDLGTGMSLPALHDDTAQMLRLAQSQGAKAISLAATHTSPTASTADLILVCPS